MRYPTTWEVYVHLYFERTDTDTADGEEIPRPRHCTEDVSEREWERLQTRLPRREEKKLKSGPCIHSTGITLDPTAGPATTHVNPLHYPSIPEQLELQQARAGGHYEGKPHKRSERAVIITSYGIT
ncbi:uncharacterized protein SEPMUDRAFT_111171 [Sphaerulina musiva SO2202]|uniref:Uncharacterized protein n=1 Tax=Sphaerulina musiva (strain SO2202) TaxID=692275 RepID=N1QDT3_SPHMS|nr:uncharacterized protein SEPMUDRAFT_111171 [Sphaerulina musiva SO2202]EMF09731.1 hypothetical protein SEPMUDRAFT_111171 [Sphaerulina musiva SO2202]